MQDFTAVCLVVTAVYPDGFCSIIKNTPFLIIAYHLSNFNQPNGYLQNSYQILVKSKKWLTPQLVEKTLFWKRSTVIIYTLLGTINYDSSLLAVHPAGTCIFLLSLFKTRCSKIKFSKIYITISSIVCFLLLMICTCFRL